MATEYIKLGITVEVITNGSDAVSGEPIATATGNNMAHNIDVYEDLARIDIHKITKPIAEVMQNELNATRKRKVIILISHYFGEGVIEEFKEASAQGFDIMWVLPKDPSTKVTIENMDKVFIWEVREK